MALSIHPQAPLELVESTPLPREAIPLVSEVSGVLTLSSMMSFRELGFLEQALARLSPATREVLEGMTAASWLSLPLALEYYAALDSLNLSSKECFEMGRVVGARANRASLATAARTAVDDGDAWPGAFALAKMWLRLFRGGGLRAARLGPREARLEVMGYPGLRSHYISQSSRGWIHGFIEPFCQQMVVTELASPRPGLDALYRAQWR